MKAANSPETSSELLRRSSESGDEEAFRALVHRHLDHVHSVALRRVAGDTHGALDISQSVFADLARQVHGRRCDVTRFEPLSGWLHRHTCFVAAKMVRGEQRRRARESQAFMNSLNSSDTDWSQLAPWVDDAVNRLPPADRDALILRFFECQDLRSIGTRLGVTDDAAQKRVTRALDKLRGLLAERGITSTAGALGIALGQHAVASVPTGLSVTIVASALAAASTGPTSYLMALLTATHLKSAGIALVIFGTGAALTIQRQKGTQLRAENLRLLTELSQRGAIPSTSPNVATEDQARLRAEHAELLRLRGEVASLRRTSQQRFDDSNPISPPALSLAVAQPLADDEVEVIGAAGFVPGRPPPPETVVRIRAKRINSTLELADLKNLGNQSPVEAAQTLLWATLQDPHKFDSLIAADSSMLGPREKNSQLERLRKSLRENLRNSAQVNFVLQMPEASLVGAESVVMSIPQTDREQPVGLALVFKPKDGVWMLEQMGITDGRPAASSP